MADKLWKQLERWLAKHHPGGERIPINGRGNQADVETPRFLIEAKERAKGFLPKWFLDWVGQAQKAKGFDDPKKNRMAIIHYHEKGWDHKEDLVIMRLEDFDELAYGRRDETTT